MAAWRCYVSAWQNLTKNEPILWRILIRQKFTRSRIPESVFQPRPGDHEKYGGNPEEPHKLHLITRIRSGRRRPYWEKELLEELGLTKETDHITIEAKSCVTYSFNNKTKSVAAFIFWHYLILKRRKEKFKFLQAYFSLHGMCTIIEKFSSI